MIVYDSHELEAHRHNNWTTGANATRTSYERDYICNADRVVTVNDSIARFLSERYSIPAPLVVQNSPYISNLIEVPEARRLKKSLGLSGQRLIAYTGKVTTGRGLFNMLEIMKWLPPELHFAMVGPNDEKTLVQLLKQATEDGLADRIHYVPKVPADELVSYISDADVAVVPIENVCLSYYLSLPNKVFEAALAGLPLVVSAMPEMEAFISRYSLGEAVNFEKPQEAAASILQLLERASAYNNRSKAEELRKQLSFEKPLASLIEDLLQILEHGNIGFREPSYRR
jgi:glycosyltransferase involved in cell wall biosynthesis